MNYVIKVRGDKVRYCNTDDEVKRALLFIKGGIAHALKEENKLPRAEKEIGIYADERSIRTYGFHYGVTVRSF